MRSKSERPNSAMGSKLVASARASEDAPLEAAPGDRLARDLQHGRGDVEPIEPSVQDRVCAARIRFQAVPQPISSTCPPAGGVEACHQRAPAEQIGPARQHRRCAAARGRCDPSAPRRRSPSAVTRAAPAGRRDGSRRRSPIGRARAARPSAPPRSASAAAARRECGRAAASRLQPCGRSRARRAARCALSRCQSRVRSASVIQSWASSST